MRIKMIFAALAGICVGMTGTVDFNTQSNSTSSFVKFGISKAYAQRGGARRTARRPSRRTTRRVVRRHSISGCSHYRAYYNCGGVYYQPIVESGTTVYIVVNP